MPAKPALRLLPGSGAPAASSRIGALCRVHREQAAYDDAQWAWLDAVTNTERSVAKFRLATAAKRLQVAEARLWRIESEMAGQPWLDLVGGSSV